MDAKSDSQKDAIVDVKLEEKKDVNVDGKLEAKASAKVGTKMDANWIATKLDAKMDTIVDAKRM